MQSILWYYAYSESHLSHLTWNRGLSICDSPFDVLYHIFSVAIYFFSHIDLSLCHILSKILWLKQDACGMELPLPLLFSAYIFIFNKISWLLDLLLWTCPYPYINIIMVTAAYIGRPSTLIIPKPERSKF
jgi:hypothetical protein